MPQWVDPAAAYVALAAGHRRAIWLDAGPGARSGLSYISIPTDQELRENVSAGDVAIFERLRSSLEHDATVDTTAARDDGFSLGWVGWLGYELAAHTAGVPTADARTPDALFVYVDWALEFDHERETLDLLVLGDETQLHSRQQELLTALKDAELPLTHPAPHSFGKVTWRHSPAEYQELVQRCLDAITAGDAYQLCLTNEVQIKGRFDAREVFLRLREANPSHHGGLIVVDDLALLSSSPEVFLSVDSEGHLTTKPIKGTRRRGTDNAQDAALAEELLASEKEQIGRAHV